MTNNPNTQQVNQNGTKCVRNCMSCKGMNKVCRIGQKIGKGHKLPPNRSIEELAVYAMLLAEVGSQQVNVSHNEDPKGLYHTSVTKNEKLVGKNTSDVMSWENWATTHPITTCPDSCPFKTKGCYGHSFPLKCHWEAVNLQMRGWNWKTYLLKIQGIRSGSILRVCQVGDLPHINGEIHTKCLDLARACQGKQAWTYTHHDLQIGHNEYMVREMTRLGLVVNISLSSISEIGKVAADLPQCVVVPEDWKGFARFSHNGRNIRFCPAQVTEGKISCSTCGNGRPFCARAERSYIICFKAHGVEAGYIGK